MTGRKIVVGVLFKREPFRTAKVYAVLKDLVSGAEKKTDLAYDSWTNKDPLVIDDQCKALASLEGLAWNKPDLLGRHRCLVWLKQKAFSNFEKAEAFIKDCWRKAVELDRQNKLRSLEAELEV